MQLCHSSDVIMSMTTWGHPGIWVCVRKDIAALLTIQGGLVLYSG